VTVIDANAYLGHWPFRKLSCNSVTGLIALMDRNGIERAVVSPLESVFYEYSYMSQVNSDLAQEVGKFPYRFLPFYTVNPGFPGWEDDLKFCVTDLMAKGIRLYPNYHGYKANSSETKRLFTMCAQLNLPVYISLRFEDERVHHPLAKVPPVSVQDVGEALIGFPGLKVILGGIRLTEIEDLQRNHPDMTNYVVEMSYIQTPFRCFERLVDLMGEDRVLFGTGMPYWYPESALLKIKSSKVSNRVKEKVLGENFLCLIGAQA
jgi:predicted TIM-barrel fold metal-dependent hydrolase